MRVTVCGLMVCVWAIGSAFAAPVERKPMSASAGHDRSGIAIGAKIGTLGPGADLTIRLVDTLNLRLNANYFKYTTDRTIDDIDFDAEAEFNSLMALLDWHPFDNGLRLTAGAILNNNEIRIDATPTDSETIGGTEYPPELIGTLKGLVEFENSAPYVGIGYGRAVGRDARWSFSFDLGVLLQTLQVDLTADSPLLTNPITPPAVRDQFIEDLEKEEEDIQEDLDNLEIYPVISFGVAYQF